MNRLQQPRHTLHRVDPPVRLDGATTSDAAMAPPHTDDSLFYPCDEFGDVYLYDAPGHRDFVDYRIVLRELFGYEAAS